MGSSCVLEPERSDCGIDLVVHPVDRCDGTKEIGDALRSRQEMDVVIVDRLRGNFIRCRGVTQINLNIRIVGRKRDACNGRAVDIVCNIGRVVFLLGGKGEPPGGENAERFDGSFCREAALVGGAEADGIAHGDECAEEIKGL